MLMVYRRAPTAASAPALTLRHLSVPIILMKQRILDTLEDDLPPPELSPPQQAWRWLRTGGLAQGAEWRKAHEICQSGEGQHDYDHVHALVHWIEGDMGNTDYWYRRVGEARAPSIETEWARVASAIHD